MKRLIAAGVCALIGAGIVGPKRFHIRCVRGGAIAERDPDWFTLSKSTVDVRSTGLRWQSSPDEQPLTWEQALHYARGLGLGGYNDWRVPSIEELQSLTDVSLRSPAMETQAFHLPPDGRYWSATTLFHRDADQASILDSRLGVVTYSPKTVAQ